MKDVVMVTGAGSGLGESIAALLLETGYRVVFADLSRDAAERAVQRSGASPAEALHITLDVREKSDFQSALSQIQGHFGQLHALVNNAALTLTTPVMDIEPEEFDRVISTNLRGTFLGCQVIGKYFSEQQYGRIVNMASLAGQNGGTASGAHYASSKGGIITLSKVFARALSASNVTVNAIAPGPVDSPAVHALVPADKMDVLLRMIPVGRLGNPAFIASMVAMLISRQAESVTGATWDANGGIYMR